MYYSQCRQQSARLEMFIKVYEYIDETNNFYFLAFQVSPYLDTETYSYVFQWKEQTVYLSFFYVVTRIAVNY